MSVFLELNSHHLVSVGCCRCVLDAHTHKTRPTNTNVLLTYFRHPNADMETNWRGTVRED